MLFRSTLLFSLFHDHDIHLFWTDTFPLLVRNLHIQKIIVSRTLPSSSIPNLSLTDFRFLNSTKKPYSQEQWKQYLAHSNWIKHKDFLKKHHQSNETKSYTQLKWNHTISTTSLQIADLCNHFNFII